MLTLTQTNALQLSQLTSQIDETISNAFSHATYWVIADVSNHSFYPNKDHHYFELVEKDDKGVAIIAKAQAVAWKAGGARIRAFELSSGQRFKNGIRVCLKVQVDYHPVYGLKLVVQDIDSSYTIGQLELQRLATINRLLQLCHPHIQKIGDRFKTNNNSLTHNPVIQRIAVVSSSSSAGYHDFMHTLQDNKYGYKFDIKSFFITVQGEANAGGACKKLEEICSCDVPFDTVVIIRGGGADTDFLIFDQYELCEVIAQLHIPVITGIGHLKNETIVDLMAHTSTKTPTKAAEFIIAHNLAFEQKVLAEQQRIVIKSQQILNKQSQGLLSQNALIARKGKSIITGKKEAQERLKEKLMRDSRKRLHQKGVQLAERANQVLYKPKLFLSNERNDVKNIAGNLKLLSRRFISSQEKSVNQYESMCRMMSPVNILKKGFALIYHHDKIITDGSTLTAGGEMKVRLADSEITVTVQQKQQKDGHPFDL